MSADTNSVSVSTESESPSEINNDKSSPKEDTAGVLIETEITSEPSESQPAAEKERDRVSEDVVVEVSAPPAGSTTQSVTAVSEENTTPINDETHAENTSVEGVNQSQKSIVSNPVEKEDPESTASQFVPATIEQLEAMNEVVMIHSTLLFL